MICDYGCATAANCWHRDCKNKRAARAESAGIHDFFGMPVSAPAKPVRMVAQEPCDIGLFSCDARQPDMIELIRQSHWRPSAAQALGDNA